MSTDTQRSTGGTFQWEPPTCEVLQQALTGYVVVRLLGRGGMGAVYEARQISLDRRVAVKILPPEAADDVARFRARFQNEARTMARLNHPGIVQVHDFGETTGGLLFIVMEFIEGTDVAQILAGSGVLPAAHAHAITAHVCDALHYAHSQGVIHRDIKPANIMLNLVGQVKVADFGLARLDEGAKTLTLTQADVSMGTPDFVAPEVITSGLPPDHRADLYAVGVMLYQMLTGEVPRGIFEFPSQRDPNIDPRFDAIIRRAMQQQRDARYQSAADLRADLDA
ncbi:MAG: hypothetical protein B7Z37_14750, partial [Verrucomicrobia bacterium 12-59-8]